MHLLSDFKINSGRQHIRLNILVDRSVIVLVGPPLRVQRTSCFIENCRHRTQPVRVIFPAPTRLPTPAPAPIPSPPPLPAPHAPAPPLPAPHAPAVLCFLKCAFGALRHGCSSLCGGGEQQLRRSTEFQGKEHRTQAKFPKCNFGKIESFKMQLSKNLKVSKCNFQVHF